MTRMLAAALVAAGALASVAAAAPQTTSPGGHALIGVRITDRSINVFDGARMARGVLTTFFVANAGKRVHDFSFLGKKTPPIRPGQSRKLTVMLLARGAFVYRSTFDKGARFRGLFIV